MAKRKIPFILTIILGILPLLFFAFAFDAHAESTSETPRQLCDDARRDGSYTILEDTQDRCVYVLPGVIKHEHFYQGNQLCYRGTGFKDALTFSLDADGEVTTECFDRVYLPAPTQEVVKQPSSKPTTAPEKSEVQETEAKVLIFGTDVKAGDTINAEGKSKIVIFMPDGGKIDLKEGAKMRFYSEDEIEAQSGIFRFLINQLTGGKVKKVRTGDMAVSIRGTEFLVEVGKNSTAVKVIDGTVEASSVDGKGTVQVAEGQETKTVKGGLPAKPKVFDLKTLDRWWEGLPNEAPSDDSDLWVGLIILGVLGGGIYWILKKIINALRGKEKSKKIEAPVKNKRRFSPIFLLIVAALAIMVVFFLFS
ncbi:FecR domain-containing protein [Candidatus Microgenomates bacterium]|nr:FecR domain-containing protein [Candidatus Microgenomates bacterium]